MPFKFFSEKFFHRLAQEQEGFLLCDYPEKNHVRAIAGETESMADAGEGEQGLQQGNVVRQSIRQQSQRGKYEG